MQGMTMRDYVLELIEEDLARPTIREWSSRLVARGASVQSEGNDSAEELIRRERRERDSKIAGSAGRPPGGGPDAPGSGD